MTDELEDKNKGGEDGADDADKGGEGDDGGGNTDTVSIKKEELEKIKSDLENYKRATLDKKAEERELKKKEKEDKDGSKDTVVMDEKKFSDLALKSASDVLRQSSEKTAKRQFFKDNPEYLEDKNWNEFLTHLTFKGDEISPEDVYDRLDAALLEHKRKSGKLEEYLNSEKERSRRQGQAEGFFSQAGSGGQQGDKNEDKKKGKLSSRGREIARAMHVDPDKVEKVDIEKDNVIDVTQPVKK